MPLDSSVFDAVSTQLFPDDRRSILAIQELVAERFGTYSYLEVGSFLGGSLQPHLIDDRCVAVYSIDPRPPRQPDERGERFAYPDNTTQRMLDTLRPHYGDRLSKLECFDLDASAVRRDAVAVSPRLVLIDGEHTDDAVLSDFRAVLELADRPCVVMFDDAHIVYRGLQRCVELLRERAVQHRAYVLPSKIAVIEVGDPGFYRSPQISELLASPAAFFFVTDALDHYRRVVIGLKRQPFVRTARRLYNWSRGRKGAIGGTRAR